LSKFVAIDQTFGQYLSNRMAFLRRSLESNANATAILWNKLYPRVIERHRNARMRRRAQIFSAFKPDYGLC